MELGILSLGDLQTDSATGHLRSAAVRTREIVSYGIAADQGGLDVFALGEHHSLDFAVSSPAVVLAAIAQATGQIRLTSAVSILGTLDPVRLHQDFASLDLISAGRAEIIAGRGAFLEAFELFGVDRAHYDKAFMEKLGLLLALRDSDRVTWSGSGLFRPPLRDAQVPPRPVQDKLPVWLGVGGSAASVARAGQLGLPIVFGLVGGDIPGAGRIADQYRANGGQAGHRPEQLKLGVTSPFFLADTSQAARVSFYPHYREYLRPKVAGRRGWVVGPGQFDALAGPDGPLMTGSPQEVIDKLLAEREILGIDRFIGHADLGGLPPNLVNHSIELFATEVVPVIRKQTATS